MELRSRDNQRAVWTLVWDRSGFVKAERHGANTGRPGRSTRVCCSHFPNRQIGFTIEDRGRPIIRALLLTRYPDHLWLGTSWVLSRVGFRIGAHSIIENVIVVLQMTLKAKRVKKNFWKMSTTVDLERCPGGVRRCMTADNVVLRGVSEWSLTRSRGLTPMGGIGRLSWI